MHSRSPPGGLVVSKRIRCWSSSTGRSWTALVVAAIHGSARGLLDEVFGDSGLLLAVPLIFGERFVHVRQPSRPALPERRDGERLAPDRSRPVEGVRHCEREPALAAELRVELGLAVAGDDRRELAVAHE